jgi:hypothetical protein
VKTRPYPFVASDACLDVAGERAKYRINISCESWPSKSIHVEATELMRRLGEALNKAESEREYDAITNEATPQEERT